MSVHSLRHARLALVSLLACRCTHPGTDAPAVVVAMTPTVTVIAPVEPVYVVQAVPTAVPTAVQVVAQDPPQAPLTSPGSSLHITCPAPVSVAAGRAVTVTAVGQGAGPLRYRWTVPNAPSAAAYRFAPRYDRADSDSIVAEGATVPFVSVVVGTFTLHAELRDGAGQTAACDVPVSVQPHGLRVELAWDTDNTDVDLHMLAGPAGQWFSQTDCYYANLRPDAALGPEAVQRGLDRDDTDGRGPENIRVDEPAMNTDYTVGVNYYSSHGQHGPTHATVVVYCGNEQVAHMERAIVGDRGGAYQNDFWTVGVARVDADGRCGFRRVDHMGTASPPGMATAAVAE